MISSILFQSVTPAGGQETMILCTAYGLLIYECTITKAEQQEESKRSKRKKDVEDEDEEKDNNDDDKPKIALNATYKLSVLPDERILDCLSFEAAQYEP